MKPLRLPLFALAAALLLAGCAAPPRPRHLQATGFIGLTNSSVFRQEPGAAAGEIVLTMDAVKPAVNWDELVVSWNVTPGTHIKVEARGDYPLRVTHYYTMGLWSDDPARYPRQSVSQPPDADGSVRTDTLALKRPGALAQVRLTLGTSDPAAPPQLKFLGLSFCNTRIKPKAHPPNRAAWGVELDVPERRQGEYAGGGGWCSPASVAMVLAYWSAKLHRPDLDRPVPEVAAAVYDPVYHGTGNWPFNTAYAGGFSGMRAYVTRLNDLSEVEDWIAAGVPVVLSTSSYLARDPDTGPDNGHLVVCRGFTKDGNVIANDPGVSVKRGESARRVFPRAKVLRAWERSHHTVYLVYPEDYDVPANRAGDWGAR
jgi:hypothetical protein